MGCGSAACRRRNRNVEIPTCQGTVLQIVGYLKYRRRSRPHSIGISDAQTTRNIARINDRSRTKTCPCRPMKTPWGESEELRERKLRPGGGRSRAATERNQRERLFAALTATVGEKGYEATRVADLVALSGVSRSSFYSHFEDKQSCFVAAVDALTGPTLGAADEGPGGGGRRGAGAGRVPGAARMGRRAAGGGEDVPGRDLRRRAGSGGAARLDLRRYWRGSRRRCSSGSRVARECRKSWCAGIVGGVQKAVYKRLLRGEAGSLRRSRPRSGSGCSAYRRLLARCGRRGASGCGRGRSRSARRPPPRPTGCCGRWRRWSPSAATGRRRWPRSSTAPTPPSAPSTRASATRRRRWSPRSTPPRRR